MCKCAPYYSGETCEIKAGDLVALETFSKSVSAFAVACVLFYVLTIVSLDALKYIFRVEPSGLEEQRHKMRRRYAFKKINKERGLLTRRVERLTRSIKKLRDYRFHYLRWRAMRFIDDPTASSSSSSSAVSITTATVAAASLIPPNNDISSYFSSFSIQKLADN